MLPELEGLARREPSGEADTVRTDQESFSMSLSWRRGGSEEETLGELV